MLIFCRARTSDGLIDSVQVAAKATSINLPANNADYEFVEISDVQMQAIQADMRFPYEGGLKWKLVNGVPEEQPDTRPYLEITNTAGSNPVIPEGTQITLNMQVKNAAGNNLSFNGSRPFIVTKDRVEKRVKITVANGQKQVVRTFPVGEYSIRSADPSSYYVTGYTSFSVEESWD